KPAGSRPNTSKRSGSRSRTSPSIARARNTGSPTTKAGFSSTQPSRRARKGAAFLVCALHPSPLVVLGLDPRTRDGAAHPERGCGRHTPDLSPWLARIADPRIKSGGDDGRGAAHPALAKDAGRGTRECARLECRRTHGGRAAAA